MELNKKDLEDVKITFNTQYSLPVFTLANGKSYIASTGELSGYYEEVKVKE